MKLPKDIIEDTFSEIYNNLNIHKEDVAVVMTFIEFIDKININTFFTEESKDAIVTYIVDTSEKQETILDFINNLNIRLSINGLDTKEVFKNVKENFNAFSTSKELPENLSELLKPESASNTGVVIEMSFLIRLYGINLIQELKK